MDTYTMKEWEYHMTRPDYWEGVLSAGQVDFIIDECKKSLAFGDYFGCKSCGKGYAARAQAPTGNPT